MRAGGLDEKITVQVFSEVENDLGEPIKTWADSGTFRASRSFGTGEEVRKAAQEQSYLPVTFYVRAHSKTKLIRPITHRIIHEGETYDITSASPSKRRKKYIMITAKVRTS